LQLRRHRADRGRRDRLDALHCHGRGAFSGWVDPRREWRHPAKVANAGERPQLSTSGTGGNVKAQGTKITAAMAATLIAIGAATHADAQTVGGTPGHASAPNQAVATSPIRNRPDHEIVREVRRALARAPTLHSSGIHVQAHVGVVTLTGWVPHRSQVQRATNAARSVRGVRRVNNRLNVRTRGGGVH
jgi:osmotically-inducible protein OsmY